MIKLKNIAKEVISEAQAEYSMLAYKIADSFTLAELSKLHNEKKISTEIYNGATRLLKTWMKNHPTYKPGRGAYKKEMTNIIDKVPASVRTKGPRF